MAERVEVSPAAGAGLAETLIAYGVPEFLTGRGARTGAATAPWLKILFKLSDLDDMTIYKIGGSVPALLINVSGECDGL